MAAHLGPQTLDLGIERMFRTYERKELHRRDTGGLSQAATEAIEGGRRTGAVARPGAAGAPFRSKKSIRETAAGAGIASGWVATSPRASTPARVPEFLESTHASPAVVLRGSRASMTA